MDYRRKLMAAAAVLLLGAGADAQYSPVQTVVVGVPVQSTGAGYYYSVGEDPNAIAEKVAELLLKKLPRAGGVPEGGLSRDDFRLGARPADADAEVLALFDQTCVRCHKPGAVKPGNIQLLTTDRRLFKDPNPARESARRERILASVDHTRGGEMPQGGPPLTPRQFLLLQQFAKRTD